MDFSKMIMMWLKKISLVLAGVTLSIPLATANSDKLEQEPTSIVSVIVVNQSGQQISEVKIANKDGVITHHGLDKNDHITFTVNIRHENSYSMKVRLKDGKLLEDGMGYVETGSTTTETVFDDHIESGYGKLY